MRLILFLCLLTFNLFSQKSVNYLEYHKLINKAEELYFFKKDVDSSLSCYKKVFKEYDFVFIKDILTAGQIAAYEQKPFEKYIELGFKHGLKVELLKNFPLFKEYYDKIYNSKRVTKIYELNRKTYLERINFNYLDWIYDVAIQDQINKFDRKTYVSKTRKNIISLEKKIIEYGFPGEKLLGIADSTIFRETNSIKLDFYQRVKLKDKSKLIGYFSSGDEDVCIKLPFLILVHEFESYKFLQKYWLEEIKKGNIHPRVVGMIHDNTYRCSNCSKSVLNGYYGNNIFTPYNMKKWDRKAINELRSKIMINTLEVDEIKEEYQKNKSFNFVNGLFHHR